MCTSCVTLNRLHAFLNFVFLKAIITMYDYQVTHTHTHTHTHTYTYTYICIYIYASVPHDMRDIFLSRDQTCVPCSEVQSPNHWTAREFPSVKLNVFPTLYVLQLHCCCWEWRIWDAKKTGLNVLGDVFHVCNVFFMLWEEMESSTVQKWAEFRSK